MNLGSANFETLLGACQAPKAGLKSPKDHGFIVGFLGSRPRISPQRIGGGLMLFCAALVTGVYFYGQNSKNKERL